jgi:hypothetical protein
MRMKTKAFWNVTLIDNHFPTFGRDASIVVCHEELPVDMASYFRRLICEKNAVKTSNHARCENVY